ncbi:MAG: transcriptional regulator [Alphaproteobacteria bacterium]|nr:transcriptional regulator [Alphaproteobacteria bacterium]
MAGIRTARPARPASPGSPAARLDAAILRVLAAAATPMGTYAIMAAIARLEERSIYPNQVYRALERLIGAELVDRVEMSSGYLLRPGLRGVILICSLCGGASQVDAGPLHEGLRKTAERHGFSVERTIIEASGRCSTCIDVAEARASDRI